MKKLLSVLLIVSMLFLASAMLASCGHTCVFSDAWTGDATHHWHACTNEKCELVADKAEHIWDEGKITTKATQEADGVKTFTCTVCAKTKTESVAFTGMTGADWNAAFANSVFENFAYNETATIDATGFSMETETIYKFTEDDAWVKMTMAGQSEESYAPSKSEANALRKAMVASIKEMTPYVRYTYDAASKTYKANSAIYIEGVDASTSDVTLTFADGKLVKIEYSVDIVESGVAMTATSVVTLSEYGEVVLN